MTPAWDSPEAEPAPVRPGPLGWALGLVRGGLAVAVLAAGLVVLGGIRLLEWPVFGARRPLSAHVPRLVSRVVLALIGLRFRARGQPLASQGAVVANHVSWLDILVLNGRKRVWFVAKAEVAGWPLIGWLARATGTLFIRRDRRAAGQQVAAMQARLALGQRLLFFPEGTSTDGVRVLPFKSTLFAAFMAPELRPDMQVQPVSVVYRAPAGQDRRFYGWWGEMALAPHLLKVLTARPQGEVTLIYHPPVRAAAFADRKQLAAHCEAEVRKGLEQGLREP